MDRPIPRRAGFTLFELMIVLSIMAIVAAMSWPRMLRYVEENVLKENVETVRRELAGTRMLAIESGLTYQFRFEPNKRAFAVLPFDRPETPESNSADGSPRKIKAVVGELAEGCSFLPATDTQGRSTSGGRLDEFWLALLDNGALYSDTVWSQPILFRASGEGQDARLTIRDTAGRTIVLTVRGLTGGVTVERMRQGETLP